MFLYYENINKLLAGSHKEGAKDLHKTYRIMIGNLQSAPTIMMGYENIVYGEYPHE